MMMKQLAGVIRKDVNQRQETAMAEAMRAALQAEFNRQWRKVCDQTIESLEQQDRSLLSE